MTKPAPASSALGNRADVGPGDAALASALAGLAGIGDAAISVTEFDRIVAGVDAVSVGETGELQRPTPIRDARTGDVLRT